MITDEQILEAAEPFGAFEFGDAQGHKRIAFAHAVLALAAPASVALTPAQIDKAARTLAAAMDYPWEHMPARGRDEMRKHASAVINAATGWVDQLSQGVLR